MTQKELNYLRRRLLSFLLVSPGRFGCVFKVRNVCEKVSAAQVARVYCWFSFEITQLQHSLCNSFQNKPINNTNELLNKLLFKKRQCLGLCLFNCLDVCLLVSLSLSSLAHTLKDKYNPIITVIFIISWSYHYLIAAPTSICSHHAFRDARRGTLPRGSEIACFLYEARPEKPCTHTHTHTHTASQFMPLHLI